MDERLDFKPVDPAYEQRVRDSFAQGGFLRAAGAEITAINPGRVEVMTPYSQHLTQQDGYLHAGVVTALVDTACGYAAYTLMPAGSRVLTVEFKINLLAPAEGERFLATGRAVKPGRTLTVCQGELFAVRLGEEHLVAVMQATLICLAAS